MLIFAVLTVLISSCKKEFTEKEEPTENKTMVDLTINDNFNWKTIKDIKVSLTGSSDGVVYIKSPKGDVYLKAFLNGGQRFDTKITVPTYVTEATVVYKNKEHKVSVVNNTIEHNFN